MKTFIGLMFVLGFILTTEPSTPAADGKLNVVAAENFYGDVARQTGAIALNAVIWMYHRHDRYVGWFAP